jgi:signal transduction histidine kinase
MDFNAVTNIENCYYGISSLIYYSHIPTGIFALLVAVFVFLKNRNLSSALLLGIAATFSAWLSFNLILWIHPDSTVLTFVWSLFGFTQPLIYLFSFYFVYIFINKNDTSFAWKLLHTLLFLPLIIFNNEIVAGFDYINCEVAENRDSFYLQYYFIYQFAMFLWILIYGFYKYIREKTSFKKQILLLLIGVELFLLSFFVAGFLASYLAEQNYKNAFEIEQYGLFSMTFFIGMLSYMIVKFKAFNIKMAGAQALVIGLLMLVGSLLFVAKSDTTRIVAGATLVFTAITGFFLVRSVKKEIQQREELEMLTQALEKANARLRELDKAKSEFVSIASHQLRSPLTAMRGYASMLVEGSFGKIPEKAAEAAKRIDESAKLMAMSVEDYLNVSRIEAGNMKYNLSDFNVKEMVEHICDDIRPEAMKKNLVLLFRSDIVGRGIVNADVGKTHQIIHNLINNSLKYTPKGSINVFVHDDIKTKRVYISITDTGIGMSEQTAHTLFQKFSRAENANSVNVSGTGLGLYVALKMAEQMGGTITAESEGDGKGSTFTFELPLAM